MSKKILITVGGTGGHIFPAVALGLQLLQAEIPIELLFVGGNLTQNPYFDREIFAHLPIDCATFKKKNPWSIGQSFLKIFRGVKQSSKILKIYQPDLIVGFGSYYTLPVLLASKMRGIPFLLHEANSIPGKVNRLLSIYASATGIHFPESANLLRGKTYEVGLPLRPGYHKGACSRQEAREYFNLDSSAFTILIFGGSQGAMNLNHLVVKTLTDHLKDKVAVWQVIHFAGDAAAAKMVEERYQQTGIRACVKIFEPRMDLAWQAADLSIARAGAGTIAEQMEFEVPGILVPYPYATDNHQDKNANFLVNGVGGAIKYEEKKLTATLLAHELSSFTEERRTQMSQAMKAYKIKNRPKSFCGLVLEELQKRQF